MRYRIVSDDNQISLHASSYKTIHGKDPRKPSTIVASVELSDSQFELQYRLAGKRYKLELRGVEYYATVRSYHLTDNRGLVGRDSSIPRLLLDISFAVENPPEPDQLPIKKSFKRLDVDW
jgi:hypothetical protein